MAARGGAATAARPRADSATRKAEAGASTRNGKTTRHPCCSLYHRAVELVGKRWTGAILLVLLDGPAHFSEIRPLVPEISDRLLSERLKELEAEGIVERNVLDGSPVRVEYAMTDKGRALEPTVRALKSWANEWLDRPPSA
jgi:DNA-binding HxlR family transcriptional regulator